MSASHLSPAALAHYHGIHLVSRTEKKTNPSLLGPATVYKMAAAGVALLLLMMVC